MCGHKTQLSLAAVTIILCLARPMTALSAHPDKAAGSSSAGYRDISKQVPLRYSSVAKLNTEIESLQTSGRALGVQDIFEIVKRRITNLKSVNIDCLTVFEGTLCYQVSAHYQTDEYEVFSTLFINARTGRIEDQQAFYRPKDTSLLSEDETRSVKDFQPLSVLDGYIDFEFSELEDRKAFIVANRAGVHEYDLLPAVVTPAAVRANGIPVIVLGKNSWGPISLDSEVKRFLDAYNPATTFILGSSSLSGVSGLGQRVYFEGMSIESLAAEIAERFWDNTDIVVTRDDEYRNVLMASNLASALGVPILFVEDNSVPSETRSTIDKLQPQNVYVVGEVSATVIDILNDTAAVVELSDYDSVVDEIAAQHEVQYLVLTNINDRTDYTRLEKASRP